jgi:hypothetical protein
MSDTIKPEQKKALPSYLSISKIRKLIDLLSTQRLTTINSSTLKDDFGPTDASIAIGTLKFLDLIDENGNTKEIITGFHLTGEDRTKAILQIVEKAYSELFKAAVSGKPYDQPEMLGNMFVRIYGLVPRISEPAVRAFLFFCEEAGLKEKSATPVRSQTARPKKPINTTRQVESKIKNHEREHNSIRSDSTSIPFAEGSIALILPTKILSNPELMDNYREVLTALKKFSTECESFLTTDRSTNE